MTRGIATTEFWLVFALIVLGAVGEAIGLVLPAEHVALKLVTLAGGVLIQVAGVLGYTISRGMAKRGVS